MKKVITILSMLLVLFSLPLRAGNDTFMDYQNFNHGYCPECNCFPCRCNQPAPPDAWVDGGCPCAAGSELVDDPVPGNAPGCSTCAKPEPCDPAPVCATNCGVGLFWVGLGLAVICTAAAIIVSNNNGRNPPTVAPAS